MRKFAHRWLIVAALLSWLTPARALEGVTLQLKWTHDFLFAGYYAAQELGYYREAGLEVNIVEAQPGVDSLQNVLDGKAQYGVGNSALLLARKAGAPVVALAVIFQHSPAVLIASRTGPTQGIHDLLDKRIMVEPQSEELLAYLKQEGIPTARIKQMAHTHQPQDLIEGKVDATTAYVTDEPYYLDRAGFAYQVYTPRSAGIDFYGDNLFTTEAEIKLHPARVKAFREASLRGWQYAMAHPERIADLIRTRYGGRHGRAFYLYEAAAMAPLLRTDLVELGYMNPGRWRHIADTYADLGLLPRGYDLRGFLFQPAPKLDLSWLPAALALLAGISALTFYIYAINRRLARALDGSKKTEAALRLSEERHRLLADHASDLIWTMDLDGRFNYVSPSVEKLLGVNAATVMRQTLEQLLTPASAAIAAAGLRELSTAIRAGLAPPPMRGALEHPHRDGGSVWTETSVTGIRNDAGQFVGLLGVTRDISARRRAEQHIRHLAQHDGLTGLANRALLSDRLQLALAGARHDGAQLAVLFLDLDEFKPVNDQLGHLTGDLLLKEVALRLLACVRDSDSVARIGGDEFMVLLRVVDGAANAVAVAEKIRLSLRQPYDVGGRRLVISASIGVSLYPLHGEDETALAKNADSAMYQAKKSGHDRVQLYQLSDSE